MYGFIVVAASSRCTDAYTPSGLLLRETSQHTHQSSDKRDEIDSTLVQNRALSLQTTIDTLAKGAGQKERETMTSTWSLL